MFSGLAYDSTPQEFPSAYGLAESVERLRSATKRSAFSALAETAAVGKVSENVVRLQRVIPMVGNSFKPFFIGRFEVRGEVTVLTGKFTMLPLVKGFMSFWFAMCGLAAGTALLGGFKPQGPHATLFLLQPFLMIGAGVALVAAGKWFARNDRAWLSELIARALGAPREDASLDRKSLVLDADTVPVALKGATALLAASGAMALVAGMLGPTGESTVYGILMLALSMGIWGRRPWAWRCGFLLLGLSVCWPLFAMRTRAGIDLPVGMTVIFGIFSCAVAAIWGRWWYAQRKHFLWS
jgi:hypothetical protein